MTSNTKSFVENPYSQVKPILKKLWRREGFEPTSGYKPLLDFESSAFNRTRPSLHACSLKLILVNQ